MSVWLAPDGRPFYAGTYFPSSDRHGMPSFTKVLEAVADAWDTRRDEVLEAAGQISEALAPFDRRDSRAATAASAELLGARGRGPARDASTRGSAASGAHRSSRPR